MEDQQHMGASTDSAESLNTTHFRAEFTLHV